MSRYTHDERYKIIRYILDNEILSRVEGNLVWKDMEEAKIINRSWHSMRTQFKTTIINMLHLFDLTDDERNQILYVVENPKRLSLASDSDSDTTMHLTEENNTLEKRPNSDSETSTLHEERPKSDSETSTLPEEGLKLDSETSNLPEEGPKSNSETSTLPEEGSKLDSEISTLPEEGSKSDSETSLDLLLPVKTYCNSTCTTNTNECSRNELKSQEQQTDDSNKQINIESNNEFTKDTNSVQENSFSLQEDTELILFFKTHEHKIHDKTAYNIFQIKTSSIRSCETLEDRFVNHIIPNLFNYKCLTYHEMIVLYNRWDMNIPEELQLRIRQVVARRTRTKKIGTGKVTADKATQATEPAYENRQCNLYRAGKYIGWSDNGVKHIFIPNIDKDHSEKRREIHDQFMLPDENIHVVSLQAYATMNDVINCDTEFKLLCNEFVETGKFNSTHVLPILGKMNQVNMNFTENDLNEIVSNEQNEKET